MANSPSSNPAIVGILPATADRLTLIIGAAIQPHIWYIP
jgi:hypothetical protein